MDYECSVPESEVITEHRSTYCKSRLCVNKGKVYLALQLLVQSMPTFKNLIIIDLTLAACRVLTMGWKYTRPLLIMPLHSLWTWHAPRCHYISHTNGNECSLKYTALVIIAKGPVCLGCVQTPAVTAPNQEPSTELLHCIPIQGSTDLTFSVNTHM